MSPPQEFPPAEIAKHNQSDDIWVIINSRVYDVTKYAPEHPGGAEVLMEVAGTDGSDGFNDIGHSADARKTMASMLVGVVEGAEMAEDEKEQESPENTGHASPGKDRHWMLVLILCVVVGLSALRLVPLGVLEQEVHRLEQMCDHRILEGWP